MVSVRMPAVAGRFYPLDAMQLGQDIDRCMGPQPAETADGVLACMVPHAGYMYSGRVAGAVYRRLPIRRQFVILGPDHRGRGAPLALMKSGAWRTPLGDASIDPILAEKIQARCPCVVEDERPHSSEHSIEVQIPFLQRRMGDFTFVPIAIGRADFGELVDLGRGLGRALRAAAPEALIIASSDMNHYEPDAITRAKDAKAITAILALDERALWDVVRDEDVSMCGIGPAVSTLIAAKELGATRAVLERYATSADAGGGAESCVGYAGVLIGRR